MTMRIRGTVGLLLLFGVGLMTPGYAVAEPGAKLYELTENMSLKGRKNAFRRATSELAGFAKVGTPLCPQALVDFYSPGATFCFLNATGTDNISTQTGLGTFNGTFTVVVQGDNPVDSPERVIAKGRFLGDMNFAPAILSTIPSALSPARCGSTAEVMTITVAFVLAFRSRASSGCRSSCRQARRPAPSLRAVRTASRRLCTC